MINGNANEREPERLTEHEVEREVHEHRGQEVEDRLHDRGDRQHGARERRVQDEAAPVEQRARAGHHRVADEREHEHGPHEVGDDRVAAGARARRPHDGAQQEVHGREQQRVEDDPELTDRGVVVLGLQVGAREVPDEPAPAPELGEVRPQRRHPGRGRLVDRRNAIGCVAAMKPRLRIVRQGGAPAARHLDRRDVTEHRLRRRIDRSASRRPTPRPAPARPTGPTTTARPPPTARPRPSRARAVGVVAQPAQRGRELGRVAGRARAPHRPRRGAASGSAPARGATTGEPGREVLGELERRVVERRVARRRARAPTSIAARCSGIVVVGDGAGAHDRRRRARARAARCARVRGRRRRAAASCRRAPRPRRPPARARGSCRKLPIQPTTNRPSSPSRRRVRVAVGLRRANSSGSLPVGVITMRRSSTPMRRDLLGDRLRSARHDVGARATARAHPPRSIHGPHPGRRTPHCSRLPHERRGHEHDRRHAERARQIAGRRCGTARGVATRTRCRARATGPSGSTWNARARSPLARVLHRGLRDDGDAAVPARHRRGRERRRRTRAGAARRAPSRLRA